MLCRQTRSGNYATSTGAGTTARRWIARSYGLLTRVEN